jgi:hypothetical protein
MANTSCIRGFVPKRYLNGTPWNGQVNLYYHDSSDSVRIGVGDPVKLSGSADASGRFPSVVRAAATDVILGVAVGFGTLPTNIQAYDPAVLYNPSNLTLSYGAASTSYLVAVVDDPFVIFEIQEDNDSEDMEVGDVGSTVEMVAGDCNTSTGLSTFTLDSSTAGGATNTRSWRVLRLAPGVDNSLGTYAKWWVIANLHAFRTDYTGVA